MNNDKQQGLSQQYKNLNKQINSNPDNNQHLKTQLTEVREKISQRKIADNHSHVKTKAVHNLTVLTYF